LDKQINDYLSVYLSDYDKYEFEVLGNLKDAAWEIQDDGNFNISKNIVYIPAKDAGANNNAVTVISVKVKLYKYVRVALENIKPKTDLKESMFEQRLLEITSLRGTPLENTEDLKFLRNKSFLTKGNVLINEEVERLPILFSGDEVTAEKTIGSVTVTTQAFAREDGRAGDRIKIKTIDNKQFSAKVISNKKVFIEE